MMKREIITLLALIVGIYTVEAQYKFPTSIKQDKKRVMSMGYWDHWNPEVQARINNDIERNRKADAEITLSDFAKKR